MPLLLNLLKTRCSVLESQRRVFPRDDERASILHHICCCRFFKAASPEAFQLGIRVPNKFAARGDQIWVAFCFHCCGQPTNPLLSLRLCLGGATPGVPFFQGMKWRMNLNFWNTKRVETADFCNCTCIKDKSNGVPSSTTATSTLFRRSPWLFLTKEPKNASVGSSRKRAIRRLGKSGWVSSKYAESPTFLSFNIASVAGNVGFLGFLQQERPLKRDDGMKGCFTTLDCDFFPKLEPWGLDPWFLRLLKVEGVNIQWFFVAVWCWNGPVVKGSEGN